MTTLFKLLLLMPLILSPIQVTAQQDDTTIWLITDIHYLSPTLHDTNGAAYSKIKNTAAGKDMDYSSERMQALVYQVKLHQPDALIVSGDLSFNGEYVSMVELADYFHQIESFGTSVFVIPGNHDISNGWARQFKGDDMIKTAQVLPHDFATLFEAFGFSEALSKDRDSLSYIVKLNSSVAILMLDSNIYDDTSSDSAPVTGGRLKKETLNWIKDVLVKANKENLNVIPVLHHNTLNHHARIHSGYTLDKAEEFNQLLLQHHIPVTLSGHIHTQHISHTMTQDEQGQPHLTDIVTGAFSSSPSYIATLTFTRHTMTYFAAPLNVEQWANATQQRDHNLIHYRQFIDQLFIETSRKMGFREMIEYGWYDEQQPILETVADYIGIANLAYFSGQPIEQFENNVATNFDEAKRILNENASPSFLNYIHSIEQNHRDYTQPLEIHWNKSNK